MSTLRPAYFGVFLFASTLRNGAAISPGEKRTGGHLIQKRLNK